MSLARISRRIFLLGSFVGGIALAQAAFPLVQAGRAAPLIVSEGDARVVQLATADLARDIAAVTGITPPIVPCRAGSPDPAETTNAQLPSRRGQETPPYNATPPLAAAAPRVLIGTLDHSPEIDALVAAGVFDIGNLRGAWESFLIATLAPPAVPAPTLVIVGSDRRGTAFGVYELSQQIGVSPWHWWADSTPEKKSDLLIPDGTRRFGPPSVKYRGIFLNDEDWGLQPWAATNFEPENGGIGPKTYARVFELLLRLKANTLWPAMHACTKPFNADPRNAALADDYAIVMGSSHAEPMLRNNVGEWPHERAKDYNYVTNRDGVRAYWEERVRTNARYENLWTLGMRGIHDSAIQGTKTDAERIAVLEQVFADQWAMLTQHQPRRSLLAGDENALSPASRLLQTNPDQPTLADVPKIFCAYKEVLDLYRAGLRVPDDVTIVWPDDNFGYVRNFASPDERQRPGGFGVYYHISYLGRPLAYLWLNTPPPALIWEEMAKSYAHGADRVWIVNVGDLKPAEIGTEFFLRFAWDVNQWGPDAQPKFLREFAAREFGHDHADEVAAVLGEYYRLNFARKPEHLQWWLPKEPRRPSDWSDAEIAARRARFALLRERIDELAPLISAAKRDAFFELVAYPVHGAALANERYFRGEQGHADAARSADAELRELTRRFNDDIAGGKWRGFMRLEPADDDWKSMRIAAWTPPIAPRETIHQPADRITIEPGTVHPAQAVNGLGRSGVAVSLRSGSPLSFSFSALRTEFDLQFEFLPTHPLRGDSLRLAFAIDDGPLQTLSLPVRDGGPEWAQGVLNGYRPLTTRIHLSEPGTHKLTIRGIDDGVVLDRIVLTPASP